ncbi:hypothetical protein D1122_18985 [Cereibacter sphaeroides]|nr:hypothetical protein D1122_18985 [Cereibacter sphaeroides]
MPSGIILIDRNGLRRRAEEHGPAKTVCNRWMGWSDNGVLARLMKALAAERAFRQRSPEQPGGPWPVRTRLRASLRQREIRRHHLRIFLYRAGLALRMVRRGPSGAGATRAEASAATPAS